MQHENSTLGRKKEQTDVEVEWCGCQPTSCVRVEIFTSRINTDRYCTLWRVVGAEGTRKPCVRVTIASALY